MKLRISKNLRIIAGAAVILGITGACQTDESFDVEEPGQVNYKASQEGMTVLGEEKGIAYSVTNMQAAWDLLKEKGGRIT